MVDADPSKRPIGELRFERLSAMSSYHGRNVIDRTSDLSIWRLSHEINAAPFMLPLFHGLLECVPLPMSPLHPDLMSSDLVVLR